MFIQPQISIFDFPFKSLARTLDLEIICGKNNYYISIWSWMPIKPRNRSLNSLTSFAWTSKDVTTEGMSWKTGSSIRPHWGFPLVSFSLGIWWPSVVGYFVSCFLCLQRERQVQYHCCCGCIIITLFIHCCCLFLSFHSLPPHDRNPQIQRSRLLNISPGDFPGGLVAPHFQCRGPRFDPRSGH